MEEIISTLKNTNPWLYGVLVGLVMAFWNRIKSMAHSVLLLFREEIRVSRHVSFFMNKALSELYSRSPFFVKHIETYHTFVRDKSKEMSVLCWDEGFTNNTYWNYIFPIHWGMKSEKKESGNGDDYFLLTFWRFTINKKILLKKINDLVYKRYDNIIGGRYRVIRVHGIGWEDNAQLKERREIDEPENTSADNYELGTRLHPIFESLENLGSPRNTFNIKSLYLDKQLRHVVHEIDTWLKLKEQYRNSGAIWKRGYLLHGVPGTGKTSIIRAIGEHFDLPIYVYDLSTVDNNYFINKWKSMLANTPCIALFEDFDSVFNKRENTTKTGMWKDGITFSTFLNVLDGIEPNNGVLTFITTNRIEMIDDSIGIPEKGKSTRPGRIDRLVELGELPWKGKVKVAKKILGNRKELKKQILTKYKDEKMTPSQFNEECAALLLDTLWEENNKKMLDK